MFGTALNFTVRAKETKRKVERDSSKLSFEGEMCPIIDMKEFRLRESLRRKVNFEDRYGT